MPDKNKISKRELARQKRIRERQNKAYAKKKKKQEAKIKEDADSKKKADSAFGKTIDFLNGFIDLFMPSKSRISHDRLIKQGATMCACVVLLIAGIFVSHKHYQLVEVQKARSASFMTSQLQWSKSTTAVSTKTKPFMTQDRRTIFIPLAMESMQQLDPDASEYHVFMMPKVDDTLDYRVENVQLVSYGSTGRMFLQVNTATPVKSQPVQFLIWSAGAD